MSNKSIKDILGQFWGGKGPSSTGGSGSETVCPKGHPMDPSWTHCPRCEAESRANRSTEASSHHSVDDPDRRSNMSPRQPTVVPGGTSSDPSATRHDPGYESQSQATAPTEHRSPRRKITGVLVTFTWERQGDLFALYEGRNVIGKGTVESEGGRPCDVLLSVDATMSNEHAVILCRAGRYELFDSRSTNGTYADDEFVESAGVMLRDGARIKTGETVWLFRKLESDDAPAQQGRARNEGRDEAPRQASEWNEPREPRRSRDDSRIG
ncbi:FHA domain (plasmid) [Paraburkholderia caribensis MBA4]|uniref:FHA domain n=1 Tax=Paraburkholderia caribensis MBA4 TaxID=1323664 RepID=W4NGA8_9BURK|nr:FHA domain-containing protein [Paraburkholderia caribensis]ALL70955.1 FHA domain [Paraburkholderia caribensis MBA4]